MSDLVLGGISALTRYSYTLCRGLGSIHFEMGDFSRMEVQLVLSRYIKELVAQSTWKCVFQKGPNDSKSPDYKIAYCIPIPDSKSTC